MRNSMASRVAALALSLVFSSTTWAADPPKPATAAPDRQAVLAKLKASGVNLNGLSSTAKDGGPALNLGTGENGGEANNANDENLALVALLPELERISIYKGEFTKDGLAKLTALPKLRFLQVYHTTVEPDAFSVLAELSELKHLSIGEYPVTDQILGYAGKIRGLKVFDHTKSAITPVGFLTFLNSVDSMEGLTLFGDFVDDAGMKRIGQMKDMKRLWTDSKKVTPKAWSHLAGLTEMKDMNLSGTSLNDEGMHALEGMKKIESLMLGKTQITDAGLASLAGLVGLHDLGLDGTQITDAGMVHLRGLTKLRNLYVGETQVTAKGLALVTNKKEMVMMRVGQAQLTPRQFVEVHRLFPQTQVFDQAGCWTKERIKAAMEEFKNASDF